MTTTDTALEAVDLGRRYRRGWALQNCSFALPAGRIAGLVGPNGAGKSTLMSMSTGLLRPTTGTVRVLGQESRGGTHRRLAFLAQDKPLYRKFTVDEMLRAGRALNPSWDDQHARRLVREAGVQFDAQVGTLSGGQRTRVALAVAFGRRPALLMLDEPLADLDPLAREEVMQTVLSEVRQTGMTALISSHVLADMEGPCNYLLLLASGRVHLAGDVPTLLAEHRVLTGPRHVGGHGVPAAAIVESRADGDREVLLVRGGGGEPPIGWHQSAPTLEALAMAYLRSSSPSRVPRRSEVAA